jgi:ribosomal protein L37AE/L43A
MAVIGGLFRGRLVTRKYFSRAIAAPRTDQPEHSDRDHCKANADDKDRQQVIGGVMLEVVPISGGKRKATATFISFARVRNEKKTSSTLRRLTNQAHVATMEIFRCPKCGTEYAVTRMTQMPVWKPVCVTCQTLFMPIENGYWLVYRPADHAAAGAPSQKQ